MKNVIYYFTGTGNSLDAAARVAKTVGDCELVNIASRNGAEAVDAERIGFSFPLYYYGMPAIVHEFFRSLKIAGKPYLFSLVTCGGASPGIAHAQAERYLGKKGYSLDAGFTVSMPDNYIVMFDIVEPAKIDAILEKAHEQITLIGETVRDKTKSGIDKRSNVFLTAAARPANYLFIRRVRKSDRKFSVTDRCTGCGKCAAVCSVGNIDVSGGKPVWKRGCEQCLACIHSCPAHAIRYGSKTDSRRQYVNPGVSLGRN